MCNCTEVDTVSRYTYESENNNANLETYEWDNVWWEQTGREDARRLLYIGDSISCATRRAITAASENKVLVDGFGTSKALDNPFLFDAIRLFAKQQSYRNAVLFNNGLHGWHLADDTEYACYYERAVQFLLDEFGDTPIFILLTTSVANAEREARVQRRNAITAEIAAKYRLPIVDLYAVSVEFSELRSADGVHYTAEGYAKFAEKILADLQTADVK